MISALAVPVLSTAVLFGAVASHVHAASAAVPAGSQVRGHVNLFRLEPECFCLPERLRLRARAAQTWRKAIKVRIVACIVHTRCSAILSILRCSFAATLGARPPWWAVFVAAAGLTLTFSCSAPESHLPHDVRDPKPEHRWPEDPLRCDGVLCGRRRCVSPSLGATSLSVPVHIRVRC